MELIKNRLSEIAKPEDEQTNRKKLQEVFDDWTAQIQGEFSVLSSNDKIKAWLQLAKMITPPAQEESRQLVAGAGQPSKVDNLFDRKKKIG